MMRNQRELLIAHATSCILRAPAFSRPAYVSPEAAEEFISPTATLLEEFGVTGVIPCLQVVHCAVRFLQRLTPRTRGNSVSTGPGSAVARRSQPREADRV